MLLNFIKKKQPPLSKSLKKIKRMLVSKDPLEKRNLTIEDKKRLNKIKSTTHFLNKNNVTRTKAYIDFYKRHPEIHWAFLAHMVSRNGGWNMTDLKGGFLSRLLSKKESNAFFNFLERSNWLIFQDAYPQLLVYEESKRSGKNLFYYLPHLHVSSKKYINLITTMILSSLIGTYLDLLLVGKGLYPFPKRPFPDVFLINISFTLIVLPVLVGVYLIICDKLTNLKKMIFILSISLMMTVIEKQSEVLGFFEHHDSWNHVFSTFGYTFYLIFIYCFYHWLQNHRH